MTLCGGTLVNVVLTAAYSCCDDVDGDLVGETRDEWCGVTDAWLPAHELGVGQTDMRRHEGYRECSLSMKWLENGVRRVAVL